MHFLYMLYFALMVLLNSCDSYHLPSRISSKSKLYTSSASINPESESVSSSNNKGLITLPPRVKAMKQKLDREFAQVALPAFVSLAADPLASLVDSMYVGRLPAYDQAGMGIAISAQYSVSKLYNDPLMKTSTSLVAGKEGEELSASVATAVFTALVLGVVQAAIFFFLTGPILSLMGVSATADMRAPALRYLKWRSLGVPATTVLLVSNGIFRGRGDTTTPLYCTA